MYSKLPEYALHNKMHFFLWFDSLSLLDIPTGPILEPTKEQLKIFSNLAQVDSPKEPFLTKKVQSKEDFVSLLTLEMYGSHLQKKPDLQLLFN